MNDKKNEDLETLKKIAEAFQSEEDLILEAMVKGDDSHVPGFRTVGNIVDERQFLIDQLVMEQDILNDTEFNKSRLNRLIQRIKVRKEELMLFVNSNELPMDISEKKYILDIIKKQDELLNSK